MALSQLLSRLRLHRTVTRSVVVSAGSSARFCSSVEQKSGKEDVQYGTLADEADVEEILIEREAEIQVKRNKSRLQPAHYNILHGRVPYDQPATDAHFTLLYQKKMFGRFGRQSGLDPGHLWPTPQEVESKLDYDRVANPYSVLELASKERSKLDQEQRAINERQMKIVENMKKLDQWKKDVAMRAAKKLALVSAAKAKKEALIEEVRRHFGFKIDPKDERFKEVLLEKEKTMKKKLKEEKAKVKQERLIESMLKTGS